MAEKLTKAAELAVKFEWPYDRTIKAIAAAVTWQANKQFGISVEKFAQAFGPRTSETRYALAMTSLADLQKAAQKVVDETDTNHDTKPWPIKYGAAYGAITELRVVLAKQYGARSTGRRRPRIQR